MLLTKAELNLAKLACKDESRYALQGIAVQPEHTVVTNGHYLVAVTHAKMEESAYPETPGLEHKQLKNDAVRETVLISTDAALAAQKALPKKATVPVLELAALGTDAALHVNTLDSVQSFKSELKGTFPNWPAIIPTAKPKAEIWLSAEYLQLLAQYFNQHNTESGIVRLTIYDEQTAVRFDSRTEAGQDMTALLMPMRGNNVDFAKRPHELKPKEAPSAEGPKTE